MSSPFLPYGRQWIEDDDIEAVAAVLRSDFLTTGPAVAAFERALAESVGAAHAVAVSNGTAALHVACLAAGLGPGDEAIVPAITFLATANCVRYVGAEVVFADVDPDSGLLSLDDARARLSPRTRAILPVDLTGRPADLAPVHEMAVAHGARVIQDAAHSLGATYRESRVGDGAFADMTTFSFHPVKHVTTAEGGAVTTNDPALARALRMLRSHGMTADPDLLEAPSPGPWYYEQQTLGFNYRLTDLQSALGLSQLAKLERFLAARRRLAEAYDARLAALDSAGLVRPIARGPAQTVSAWHLYSVLIDFEAAGISRGDLMRALRERGIGTQVHYIPVPSQPYYRRLGFRPEDFPGAMRYYARTLSLPLFPAMAEGDVDRVVSALSEVLGLARRTSSPRRPRVAVIAQARMGSSRLPGKVLADIGGLSALEMLARRLRCASTPDVLVVATTLSPSDDAIEAEARRLGLAVHRGSEEDVLARYAEAAALVEAEVVVRVTADCPLLDATELDRVVATFLSRLGTPEALDYASNLPGSGHRLPRGLDVEVFTRSALERAHREAVLARDREHVTPYLYSEPHRFKTLITVPDGPDHGHLRLTVDTPDDLALVRAIVSALGHDATYGDVAAWLDAHPEVAAMNAAVVQKEPLDEGLRRRAAVAGRFLIGRADGGPGIGLGHLTRLGALLEAWVECGGRAVLRGAGLRGATRERLVLAGVTIEDLEAPAAGAEDARATAELARRLGAAAIVLDGYDFTADYQRLVRAEGIKLVVTDDFAASTPACDVVVNQNLGADAKAYVALPSPDAPRVLAGTAYVLLRSEVRRAIGSSAAHNRIVLTLGGTDPLALTVPLAEALLATLPPDYQVLALVGGGADPRIGERLASLAAESLPHGRLVHVADAAKVAELFAGATLAITAGGTTTWELLALGVPPLVIAVADNQRGIGAKIAEAGAGIDLGWHAELDLERVTRETVALLADPPRREGLARRGRALVDGRGVLRVIDAICEQRGAAGESR